MRVIEQGRALLDRVVEAGHASDPSLAQHVLRVVLGGALFVVATSVVVLVIVWGLDLHERLDAGQRVIDGARPIFVEERVEGLLRPLGGDGFVRSDPVLLAQEGVRGQRHPATASRPPKR